jgi:hypothetical protein
VGARFVSASGVAALSMALRIATAAPPCSPCHLLLSSEPPRMPQSCGSDTSSIGRKHLSE